VTAFVRDFLARLDREGVLACTCGRLHRVTAADLLVEEGALVAAAELLARRYGPRPSLWVLSDENTEAAAGARWKSLLGGAAIRARVLPAVPRPVPSAELAADLAGEVRSAAPDLLIAVGAGVISDMGKKVSLDTGVPSWCIATAPSVDAYSSATASLRVAGYHETARARIADLVICDLEVLCRAPRQMVLAGLGDLLAKFLSHLDWRVAHAVTGEHYCPAVSELALESARAAVQAARTLETDEVAAVASLTDAILVSGFAMQAMGGSRPAASVEHTIAHFWETAHAVADPARDLHGLLVGAATALVLPAYRLFYGRVVRDQPDIARRIAALAAEPPWRDRLDPVMQPYADKMAAEMRGRAADASSAHLEAYAAARDRLADMAGPLLDELAGAIAVLERLGFPFALDALGVAAPLRLPPVRCARLLRDRYTTFDLAHELGVEDDLFDAVAAGLR
jgi:glycerol-1-phosphate dehydrogenase [NAD(P)+]